MAIDDPLDEHEQGERVRNWLKTNGAGLVGGVALGLAVIFGWQWWQRQQADKSVATNSAYRQIVQEMAGAEPAKAQASLDQLRELDSGTYAALGALQVAKVQVEAGEEEAAIATLRSIRADSTLQPLVTVRLANLLTDTGKHDEAMAALGSAQDSTSQEALGDALLAAGKREQARAAYLKALTSMDVAAPQRRLVELKLSDAGGTPPNPAQPT